MLLYGNGWQVETHSPDDQIAVALAGDTAHPAIPGSVPDLIAGLYTVNGDTNTHAQATTGTIAFSPEMSTCQTASASDPDDAWEPDNCRTEFDFPDDEKLIQAEFEKNVPFARSLAESAKDPAHPVSSVGRSTPDFALDSFADSYGATQPVAVTARRSLHGVRLNFRIGKGRVRTVPVGEWNGGRRYGGVADKYYAELRGTVTGQKPGDRVTAWFTAAGGKRSPSFSYIVNGDIGGDVLVLATEDVTGIAPENTDGATSARYARTYTDSLAKAGYTTDVYDMDSHGRRPPHPLGVLSHYKTVLWETGDDIVPREPGQEEWQTTRAAAETDLAARDYLNEGGKLIYAGQYAAYDADFHYGDCVAPDGSDCKPVSDDSRQYWLDAGEYVDGGGTGVVAGTSGPLAGYSAPPDHNSTRRRSSRCPATPLR